MQAPGAMSVPGPGGLTAVITSPEQVVATGGNATAKVVLDATGSVSGPLRPILVYSWNIKRLPDGMQVAATGSKQSQVWLRTGVYAVTLTVTDILGDSASAGKIFAVWPVKETTAVIASPPPFVEATDVDGTQVCFVAYVSCVLCVCRLFAL